MYRVKWWDHNSLIKTRMNALVSERLHLMSGTVVDLGCGTAPFRDDILAHASRNIGVDWSNTPHVARADVVSDVNGPIPFDDAMADHVVSFEVIEHLSEPEDRETAGYFVTARKP